MEVGDVLELQHDRLACLAGSESGRVGRVITADAKGARPEDGVAPVTRAAAEKCERFRGQNIFPRAIHADVRCSVGHIAARLRAGLEKLGHCIWSVVKVVCAGETRCPTVKTWSQASRRPAQRTEGHVRARERNGGAARGAEELEPNLHKGEEGAPHAGRRARREEVDHAEAASRRCRRGSFDAVDLGVVAVILGLVGDAQVDGLTTQHPNTPHEYLVRSRRVGRAGAAEPLLANHGASATKASKVAVFQYAVAGRIYEAVVKIEVDERAALDAVRAR